jgi:hypothetical protein
MGRIADIYQARGELDEALRIRKEEELPVYERLGYVRLRAITMGRIADILQVRGQLDDALSIRKKEELPVYESLGDAHSRAVTMGKVAEILHARGQLDEALAIHSGRGKDACRSPRRRSSSAGVAKPSGSSAPFAIGRGQAS